MDIAQIIHAIPPFFRRHKLVQLLLFLSPRSRIQKVTFNKSARLYADISDPFPRAYFLAGSFEPEFFSIASPFLERGGVFMDVGANFGFCSFGLMACLPETPIAYHLFEAQAPVYELLRQSAKLHPKQSITITQACITDHPGVSRLHIDEHQLGSSYISEEGTKEVPNVVLDDYIEGRQIKKIGFMKMDIEGWEVRALQGAFKSLQNGLVDVLYIEIFPENLARAGSTPDDCFQLLKKAGFHLYHCKAADFASGVATGEAMFLRVNNHPLRLAPLVSSWPDAFHSDILAIHRSSAYLRDTPWEK